MVELVLNFTDFFKMKKSIFNVIQDFDSSGYVDEIIVVDNNAEVGTEEEVKKTRARIVKETKQGYGRAIRTGIVSTGADLIIIAEPDGTFDGRDVLKLLAYSDDFEMVFGSRTHLPLIHRNSEMTFFRRILDVLLGKLISLLFLCPPLTDVGCTLRITTRNGWQKIAKECKSDSAIFATEWLLVAAKNRVRFSEIPVNFKARVGVSSLTADFTSQAKWGFFIFSYILKVWFHKIFSKKLYKRAYRRKLATA